MTLVRAVAATNVRPATKPYTRASCRITAAQPNRAPLQAMAATDRQSTETPDPDDVDDLASMAPSTRWTAPSMSARAIECSQKSIA